MSWAAFYPDNIARNPSAFVGPNVAGAIVQAFETGIIVNQSVRFWSRGCEEKVWIKVLVGFVSLAAYFQTSIAFYNTWRIIVLGFGDWIGVVNLQWPDRIQPVLNCMMSAPFQAFLVWRCWNALQRRWIILVPLASLLVATVAVNVVITVKVFYFPLSIVGTPLTTPPGEYVTAFVLTAVLDIFVTALMFWYLFTARSQVVSRRFSRVVGRLLRMLWEAALPPALCAIVGCVVYITMRLENLWDVFLQSILGKLYVISLFVILNGRADLKHATPSDTPMNASAGLTRYWAPNAPSGVRIHLTTIVDQVEDGDMDLTPTTEQSCIGPALRPQNHSKGDVKSDHELSIEVAPGGRLAAARVEMGAVPESARRMLHRSVNNGGEDPWTP